MATAAAAPIVALFLKMKPESRKFIICTVPEVAESIRKEDADEQQEKQPPVSCGGHD